MAERVVTAPDGRIWRVHRKWLPRRARWLGVGFRGARTTRDGGEALLDGVAPAWLQWVDPGIDDFPALAVVALVLAALVLAWLFVFPALVFVLDLVVVVLIAAGGVATRVLFRRPWIVAAGTAGPPRQETAWPVVGWRATNEAIEKIADEIAAGRDPVLPRPTR